jgi:hypothetical protein
MNRKQGGWKASKANCINRIFGAGDGNRTHVRSSGTSLYALIARLLRTYAGTGKRNSNERTVRSGPPAPSERRSPSKTHSSLSVKRFSSGVSVDSGSASRARSSPQARPRRVAREYSAIALNPGTKKGLRGETVSRERKLSACYVRSEGL